MLRASTMIGVGLCAFLATSHASALDTLPFCDKITAPNERMQCLQAHISHLEESILGLSTQIADLNRQLREKASQDIPYKLMFSTNGKCLGQDDNLPAWVSCTDPDAFTIMDRSKTGKPKKPEAQPVIDPDAAKKAKKKEKDKAAQNAGGDAGKSTGGEVQPKTP